MSSEKLREKRSRRQSKVSWGRLVRPGLVDPKLRPRGVSDGQSVKIFRYHLSCVINTLVTQEARPTPCWMSGAKPIVPHHNWWGVKGIREPNLRKGRTG